MMDLLTLRLFITLAEQLHFRKTSERHHLTTSALTRAIQRLEESLGTQLFERNKRSVKLTDDGQRVYTFARETITAYENLQVDLHSSPDHLKGSIKVFATVTAAYSILPELIKRFRQHYPHVTTFLETGVAKDAYEHLRSRNVDFAIGIMSKTRLQEIRVKKILETPLMFVVPSNSPSRSLNEMPLIFPEQGELASLITAYFNQQKIPLNVHSYVEGHEAILAMVVAGLGAAILPKIVIDNSHLKEAVTVVALKQTLPILEVGIFTNASSLKSPIKKAFWDSV